jgi:hypothetical protein
LNILTPPFAGRYEGKYQIHTMAKWGENKLYNVSKKRMREVHVFARREMIVFASRDLLLVQRTDGRSLRTNVREAPSHEVDHHSSEDTVDNTIICSVVLFPKRHIYPHTQSDRPLASSNTTPKWSKDTQVFRYDGDWPRPHPASSATTTIIILCPRIFWYCAKYNDSMLAATVVW